MLESATLEEIVKYDNRACLVKILSIVVILPCGFRKVWPTRRSCWTGGVLGH